jgi:peroxiredoxin
MAFLLFDSLWTIKKLTAFCFFFLFPMCAKAQSPSNSSNIQTIYDLYHVKNSTHQLFIDKDTRQNYNIEEIHSLYNVTPVNIFQVEMNNDTAVFLISLGALEGGFKVSDFLNKPVDISVVDIDGVSYNSSTLGDKVIVLCFWFTSCRPCIEEIPYLNELIERYKTEDVLFLAPSYEAAESLNHFLSKRPFNYRIIPNSSDLINHFKINAFPTHIILDKKGVVRWAKTGIEKNPETGEIIIQKTLEKEIKNYL